MCDMDRDSGVLLLLTWLLLYVGGLLVDVGVGNGLWFPVVGLLSSAAMVPMVSLFVPEFSLLPLHEMIGNESDDALMMENILLSIVCFSRCRISNK